MNSTGKNKLNALLGGLLVFVVPIMAISIVYFSISRLPKSKEIPILQNAKTVGDFQFLNHTDTIKNGSLWRDLKIVFWVNKENVDKRLTDLSKLNSFAQELPEFSLKDPYAQIYFIALTDSLGLPLSDQLKNFYLLSPELASPVFDNKNTIYLLDQKENIRGEYQFIPEDLEALYTDTQYLLQDVFFENADTLRIKKMFKTSEDEK